MSLTRNAAVVDTCLLINWSAFEYHYLLKELFSVLYMPEKTFQEIRSPSSVTLAAKWLAERFLVLIPVTDEDERDVVHLMGLRAKFPQVPTLDAPETYALVLAKKFNCPLLTDNKAPRLLVKLVLNWENIDVWDSLVLLTKIRLPDGISSRMELIDEFMTQTSF